MKKALAIILTAGLTLSLAAMPTAWAAEDNTTAAEDTATADEVVVEGIEHEFDITEVTALQKHIAQISELTEAEQKFYDVNNDGFSDISDVTLIQQFVAQIKYTPKYYETSYEEVYHEAEYEEVYHEAEYEEVYHEAVTEEVPTYVYEERCICTVCGEDITDLIFRMDNAVADGRIIPGDGNYEKLTIIDGHFYNLTEKGLENEYGLVISSDRSEHNKKDIAEYGRDYWSYYAGWTGINHWLYYGTSTYVSDEDYKNDIEGYYTNGEYANERTDLRLVWEDYKKPTTSDVWQYKVIYKTTTVQEAYTEKVLVKEAYTEQVLVKEAYTEQIPIEAGWH